MFAIATSTDATARSLEHNGKSTLPQAGGNGRNGHETHWPAERVSRPLARSDHASRNGLGGVLPTRRSYGSPSCERITGHEAIARQDAADMACLCRDEEAAMTRLMSRHALHLRGVVARMLQDWAEAADVVDETFIRVHRHRHRFDLRARFSTWLYTIALNLARNRLRHRARQPEFVPLDELTEKELQSQALFAPEPAPDAGLDREETIRSLEESFAALPPLPREALHLFAYEELSQNEIGGRLHCSSKAVESRLYHARKLLRADFGRFLRASPDWISIRPFKPQSKNKIEIKT
ncbi:MAG: RNA polymerase sigma factor [Verrucomicrobiota bacterium]|jgi:RNA polymerase sigma-70 factor, ECF subfamily